MDLIKDFRDTQKAQALIKLIKKTITKPINIMEICGGHTHSLVKYSLLDIDKNINFIHGPGCPVCVMPKSRIDEAIKLANTDDVILCTLADMLRVVGSNDETLLKARAKGKDIRALYTPLDALSIAKQNPDKKVVFFAIGFETTTPMSAVLLEKALSQGIKNLYFHINHVLVPEPIKALLDDKNQIDAFLAPSHVSVIIGSKVYEPLALEYKKPFAISGFEPLDMLESVLNLIYQHQNGTYNVYNEYKRLVKLNGNEVAKALVDKYFVKDDFEFRGLGVVKNGGLKLKDEYEFLDARVVFDINVGEVKESKQCICGHILKGLKKPTDCPVFGKACTPQSPVGSCMVSSEGACAAYYKYKAL